MIIWLIGKNEEVDLIYSAYPYKQTNQPELAINTYLFETNDFKYIYNKKDKLLFQNNHNIFQTNLIIKGLTTIDNSIIDIKLDKILNIDKMSRNELFKIFIEIHNIHFNELELNYINSLNKLSELSTIITLKNLNIDIKLWPNFIKKHENLWQKQAKSNQLIQNQIIENTEIIQMINYLILTNFGKKAVLLFIKASIKSGQQIWVLYKFWEYLIQN